MKRNEMGWFEVLWRIARETDWIFVGGLALAVLAFASIFVVALVHP